MAPKKSKGTASRASSKASVKSKEKRNDPSPVGSVDDSGVPSDIFPMVVTAASQELFECRVDEDVTKDDPFKFLKKDDILQDMKRRAAVSDFHPVKQVVLNYPVDELLLVFDRDFTYGQSFYLVLTEEAKERILNPPESVDEQALEDELDSIICKTPEPKPWVSLGSDLEIEEESVVETRSRLKYKISRVRRKFGAPIMFSDRNVSETPDGYLECMPYQDQNFSIQMLERSTGTQAVPNLKSSSTQTVWKYPRNMYTQYEPREFTAEEKENFMNSEDLKNFVNLVASRFEMALQQNEIMDVFFDDWRALSEEECIFGGKTDTHLKEYQSFTDLKFSKEKTISCINWHPTISGVIAVALTERLSFEERINDSTKLLLNPSLILFWNFSDPLNPQLMLECPDDVFSFEFCPSDPNIIVGGCMNGQVVLWDISAHAERLQGTRTGGGSSSTENTNTLPGFEDKHADETPVMRYCAVSGIENSHKAPITDVQWLPDYFEVSRTGVPLENKNQMCVQIVTCAPDCCVMFWDIRAQRVATQSVTDKKQKGEEMALENPHGVPNTFKHLDLSWKPLIRVNLPKIDSSGEYSPLKFSLRDSSENQPGSNVDKSQQNVGNSEGKVEYTHLRVPSAKQLKVLEDISTKLYIGMEDGELIYTDWKMEKDNDSGRLFSAKPSRCFIEHDGPVNTVRRSPFFKDIILTVGGWTFAIWKEGVMQGPIMHMCSATMRGTVGHWSLSRPGVFFIGKEDGNIEVWDLMEKSHEPAQTQNVTTTRITCIKPWIVSSKQHLLAVSDHFGTVHILEIPWALRSPVSKEKLTVGRYFEEEVQRLIYFEKQAEMRAKEKREMDAEELRKKMESVVPEMLVEQIEEKAQKEYQDYLGLEKVILKDMGLLSEEDKTSTEI
ncbi:hypothetical protein SKAU_G00069790 [Synaphobranchus kaupii]|uniref:WD repeat-containing protein 63 n=1 Tax=Synaphobranchus kaupii TaxID=118154 RepID=A0A9Q1G6I9_SYNKA|nr:hypothetical protein SKAU_G00069790 [Synaphobranchus kaupii]